MDPFEAARFLPAGQVPAPAAVNPLAAAEFFPAPNQPPPPPQQPVPNHPVAGPSGSFWTDAQRRVGTAVADAMAAVGQQAQQWDMGARLARAAGASRPPQQLSPQQIRDNAFNGIGAIEYQPQTEAGRIGQGALAGGLMTAVTGNPAAIPAGIAGGAGAQAGADLLPNHAGLASAIGGLVGGTLASGAANLGASAIGNKIGKPLGISASPSLPLEDVKLAQAAKDYGIPLSVPQVSRSYPLKLTNGLVKAVPLNGSGAFDQTQRQQWIKGVSGAFGENAASITPEVLSNAATRIGGVFNGVAGRTSIPMSNDLMTRLQGVVDNARLNLSADSVEPVERQVMNVVDTAANNNGNIGGRAYLDLTAKGGPLDTMMQSGDSGIRQAGIQLRNVLDTALQQNAAPGDVPALMQARSQWHAMKTVEPLTRRADTAGGATPSTGDISPAALQSAVTRSYPNAARAPLGEIPLNDLGKIGQRFLKDPPTPTTAERNMLAALLAQAGAGAFALKEGTPPWAAFGVPAATLLGARVGGAALRNQFLANRAIQSSLHPDAFRFIGPTEIANPPLGFGLLPP